MNPLRHPGVRHTPKYDVEKQSQSAEKTVPNVSTSPTPINDPSLDSSGQHDIPPDPVLFTGRLAAWNFKVERLAGLEARGITRVLHEEKHGGGLHGHVQMFLLWFSINLCANNIITGLFGPLVFGLGWKDSICIAIFACALGSCGPAYTSTFGPESGNRTMILGRYVMGYWPSKLICVLNQIQQIGFGILGCIISGQIISAVNGGGLTIAVGRVISALCIGLIATFGIAILHTYERYAFIPQLMAFFVLIGSAAKDFDHSAVSQGPASVITANRCSFFALQFANVFGFSAVAGDLYVYYPVDIPKYITFEMTFSATWLGLIFCNILGIGIATGVPNVPSWTDAYEVSSGALLLETYRGLGGFGGLCAVIIALGSVTNNAPFAYTAAITFQALGRYAKAIPRWMWCIFVMIIQIVCSVAGRNHLFAVFQNFLPIMSYWVAPWVTILVEEQILFHIVHGKPFDWTAWEDKKRLPIGVAALFAFLCGWAGATIGMSQVWYQGPVALKVGGYGGDIGAWLAIAFTSVVYPPLRHLELKKLGR
ncbi:MAG: hypothetical protein LQ350_005198 [Teloschistes chrysophthalmus]|nr:MAG: hypothetical protein LQ350_005198 [Niorma chrysophthalma]